MIKKSVSNLILIKENILTSTLTVVTGLGRDAMGSSHIMQLL